LLVDGSCEQLGQLANVTSANINFVTSVALKLPSNIHDKNSIDN
jgi:hypothetical protein